MEDQRAIPRRLMLVVSVVQWLLLFGLYKAIDLETWPSQSPLWLFPLWTIAIVTPLLFLLSVEVGNENRVLLSAGLFSFVLTLLAAYTGWQSEPYDAFPVWGIAAAYILSMAIACFKALMYLQQYSAQLPMSYQVLFTFSWRNFLVLALAAVFVLVFWGILLLWAALFEVIGIDFFSTIFAQDWFIFPLLGLASGLGIIVFRELTKVIDSISNLLQGLIKLLLPLVIALAVVFLSSLPFTGLDILWATGRGTMLLLWLTALILFFSNAVYQDGRGDAPYPDVAHKLIYCGLFVLPLLSALSFYGLWLRLDQYGWTVSRCWGFLVWSVLTLFSGGYLWGIIKRGSSWPSALGRVNVYMGLAILSLMLLTNSPLLDFRKISLSDQLARVDEGSVDWEDFDFFYVHEQLGRPGYLALEKLKADIGDSDPQLLAKIEDPQPLPFMFDEAKKQVFWDEAIFRPAGFEVPDKLRRLIERKLVFMGTWPVVIFQVDLNDDSIFEYAVVQTRNDFYNGSLYYLEDDVWQEKYLSIDPGSMQNADMERSLREGHINLIEPKYRNIQIGDIVLETN
ncbi:Uncharacterised protein [Halioglobus japonicus]|nr:Uncharacterised protein [Halioglobus japonicus]